MSIKYKFETEKELLKVFAFGIADDMEETLDYAKAIIEAALKYKSKKILCDEQHLRHELGVVDTVLFATETRKAAPKVAQVAILVDINELDNLDFYETVTNNQGLFMFFTSDYKAAIDWLYK